MPTPTIQSEIPFGIGSPEGVLKAPVGYLYTDNSAARLFFKTTPEQYATGWVLLADSNGPAGGGGGQQIYQDVFANPNGNLTPTNPAKPARYSQLVSAGGTGTNWDWQVDTQKWQ